MKGIHPPDVKEKISIRKRALPPCASGTREIVPFTNAPKNGPRHVTTPNEPAPDAS